MVISISPMDGAKSPRFEIILEISNYLFSSISGLEK
jgi:hypothetical protein